MENKKRAVRPVKPKANAQPAKQQTPPAPQPAAQPEPKPVVQEAPQEAPVIEQQVEAAETQKTQESSGAQKTRVQTNKAIGVNISAARARRHIDKLNLNAVLDSLIGELKAQLASYKTAKSQLETGKILAWVEKEVDGKKTKAEELRDLTAAEREVAQKIVTDLAPSISAIESKVSALSRERTRFSNEASIVLSIVCDELIQQLVEHTMDRVLAAKKKIIQVSHLHEAGVEKLSLYPLIKSLPSFTATAAQLAKSAEDEKSSALLAAALSQAEREFKKKYCVHMAKKKKDLAQPEAVEAHVVAAEPEAVEAHDEEEHEPEDEELGDSKTTFKFYVTQVCKEVAKKDPKYKAVRVSTAIRSYLSDLLVEFIHRISPLVLLTANSMKNKTVNDVAILRTVESLLIDGHAPVELVELKEALVTDQAVLKAETAKRDEEKKAGREYKITVDAIPKVPGFVAIRTVTYPTSGYSALAEKVQQKLALYEALPQKEKAAVVEAEGTA